MSIANYFKSTWIRNPASHLNKQLNVKRKPLALFGFSHFDFSCAMAKRGVCSLSYAMDILRRSAGKRTGAGEFVEFLKLLQDLLCLTKSSYWRWARTTTKKTSNKPVSKLGA